MEKFRVGDTIKMNDKLNVFSWYSDEYYKIVSINKRLGLVALDRNISGFDNIININSIDKVTIKTERIKKLNRISDGI